MKAKFLCTIVSAALFSVAAYAQFPGGGFPGGGFPGGFGGRFPFDPQEQGGQMPGFPGGGGPGGPGGGFGGGFMMGTEYDPTTSRNDVEFTSSNLPIVIIQTDNRTLTNREKTGATMKIIDNGKKRNNVTDKPNGYDGSIKIKLRGNSSLFFDQKRFTFETLKEDGKKNKVELLGMPADNDWVLLAPYNDISMMRDVFAFDMWNNMGHWAPRTRYCEVVMNGRYIGVYILCEKIKRAENRLDIAKLKKSDTTGIDITGGYIVRIDPPDEGEKSFQSEVPGIITTGGMGGFGGGFPGGPGGGPGGGFGGGRATVTWTYFYPKSDKLTPEQEEYISNYIKTTEKVIQSDYFADPKEGYAKYIDVESFVDYIIHTELSLNADGLKRSTYFYKTKQNEDGTGGKLHAGTVWDYNLAYGNCNFANANKIDAWVYEGGETNPTPAMFKRLMEDPAFVAKVKARWKELRKGYLSDANINRFIDEHAAQLQEAQARQYAKYSDLLVPKSTGNQNGQGRQNGGFGGFGGFGGGFPGGMGGFGGGGAAGMFSAYSVSSYDEEISILKKWFADRIAFLDKSWK
jgi:uncharacterized membrane protein YgcG